MIYNQNANTSVQFNPKDILHLLEIFTMQIYRIRVDAQETPVLIKEHSDISKIGSALNHAQSALNDAQLYKFTDNDFMNLTDGEYVYKIRMEMKDPMYEAVQVFAAASKPTISILKGAIEYIHNNPQHYNELRGELSLTARGHLLTLFQAPEFIDGIASLEKLMTMFTGNGFGTFGISDFQQSVNWNPELANEWINSGFVGEPQFIDTGNYILPNNFNDITGIDRRKIENFYRICQDLMFGISKFVTIPEVVSSATENNIVNKKTNRIIYYEREWTHAPVKANLDSRMMLGIQTRQREEVLFSEITAEYTEELAKHVSLGASPVSATDFSYMNFLTPSYIGGRSVAFNSFAGEIPTETYIKIIDATLKKPEVMLGEIMTGIYTTYNDGYEGTIENLKNDSGVFETVLHEHAVTVRNKTANALDTDFELELHREREYTIGIDHGQNSPQGKFGYLGYTEEEIEAAHEELERQQNEATSTLFGEKVKKELLIMNCLIDKDAHHLLDRREFIQGSPIGLKFIGFHGYDFYSTAQITNSGGTPRMPYPRLFNPILLPYCNIAS